jgi:DNA invertase Pin-like site-specific DNA recombinase
VKKRSDSVIGYLRVSTEEQAVSGLGLADQREVIATESARRGWENVRYLSDEGFSAKNLARPAMAEALAALHRGDAGVLVVSKLDRLSRSLLDFATIMDTATRQGWQLVVLDLAIDTTIPSGALMANVMACFAEYERQLIGARTSAALQQLKAQGRRLGRPRTLPLSITERIVEERANGTTLKAIASGLTADGVPTARGGTWHPSTVKAVLTSAALDAAAVGGRPQDTGDPA